MKTNYSVKGWGMRAIIGLVCVLAMGGCASTSPRDGGPNSNYSRKLVLSPEAKKVLTGGAGAGLPDAAPNDAVLIFLAQSRPADVRIRAVEGAVVRALILNSDALCEAYMSAFITKSRATTSVLGVSSLAFSGAAGVTTPVRSANLLSALSSFTTSAQDKISKEVFADKAPELLYKAVMAQRTQERSRLLALLENKTLTDAPSVVMAQVADYHGRCGPTVGINSLTDSVQSAADQAGEQGADAARAFVENLK